MKIGLVRHFRVNYTSKYFLTPSGFNKSMENYDNASVISNGLSINSSDWDICYCSTLPRAKTTAETIYDGKIIHTDKLIEVDMKPFTNRNIILPSFFWHIGARYHWYKNNRTQTEVRTKTLLRAKSSFDELTNSEYKNILVVSHGFFLRNFYKILINNGFTGKMDEAPRNGKLYVLTK